MLFYTIFLFIFRYKEVSCQSFTPSDLTVNCLDGWYQYGNKCFRTGGRHHLSWPNWERARYNCLEEGGDLASIHSKEELEFLITFPLMNVEAAVWIGLNDKDDSGTFVWTDGTPVDFTNWDENEPSMKYEGNEENCVHMVFNAHSTHKMGKWNDLRCFRVSSYLCQMPADPTLSSPNPKYCSETEGGGYKSHYSCVHYVSAPMTWSAAEEFCQSRYDGHLVAVQDDTVHRFVTFILKEINVISPLWIGLRYMDLKRPQRWSSDWLVDYVKWVDNFSPIQWKNGACTARLRSGQWAIRPCDRKYAFICEISSRTAPLLEPSIEGSYCPPTEPPVWKDLGGDYCYYINSETDMTWHEANFDCSRIGGKLVSIHSAAELLSLEQIIRYKNRMNFHIGLYRKQDDRFSWLDGSTIEYTNWEEGEPSGVPEVCTEFRADTLRWNDIPCDSKKAYVCSVKKIPPNVTDDDEYIMCPGELYFVD